jgi:hypothetical protein
VKHGPNYSYTEDRTLSVDYANVIKKLHKMLNCKIFIRNELRRNQQIDFFTSLEKVKTSPQYHILIKVPDCKRSLGATDKDRFINKCVFNVLECLNIVDLRTLDPNQKRHSNHFMTAPEPFNTTLKKTPKSSVTQILLTSDLRLYLKHLSTAYMSEMTRNDLNRVK